MRRIALALTLLAALPGSLFAADYGALVRDAVELHILPGFERLETDTAALAAAAEATCDPDSEELRAAFHTAFDAWLLVSHLRFGPTEQDERAYALAFWPDTKGFTPKSLGQLIGDEDPAGLDPVEFSHVSVAARGFYALEFLLYDDWVRGLGHEEYQCGLLRTIAADIHATSAEILAGWQDPWRGWLEAPGEGDSPWRTDAEAAQELYKALTAGLQFTSDTRMGRPLGTFDQPRPTRAEARRSGRSLRNVVLAMEGIEALAMILSEQDPPTAAAFESAFARFDDLAADLDDPVFAGVIEPFGRLKVEIVQQSIDRVREISGAELGPFLGLDPGFNALDGD